MSPVSAIILQLGPRDFAVGEWARAEDGEPVYRIAQRGIKAASTAAVLARKLSTVRPGVREGTTA